MELFATYTFGQALLTVLEFALLFLWIAMAVTVVVDIFRSHDLSGWAKAGWIVLIVLLPLVGVLIYAIARGDNMKAHEVSGERLQARAFIADAEDLRDRGVLSDEEFQHAKQRALAA
jgi:predicted membrane channel-forming protein YqfA (hemolysin III family)